jgi:hypothetical protein
MKMKYLDCSWRETTEPARFPQTGECTFLVPVEERLAIGPVMHVAGLPQMTSGQYLALVLLPQVLCQCNDQGVCEVQHLLAIQRAQVVELPAFSLPVHSPDGDRGHGRGRGPARLGLSISFAGPFFIEEVLLATFTPQQAYEWLALILGARHALARQQAYEHEGRVER